MKLRVRGVYGPKVNANARTPGSLVTSVSTCCRRAAPATRRIMRGPIEARDSVWADVCASDLAHRLSVQQHLTAAVPDGPGCMTRFTSPAVNGEHDLAGALPELDVLAFASPVALEGDTCRARAAQPRGRSRW